MVWIKRRRRRLWNDAMDGSKSVDGTMIKTRGLDGRMERAISRGKRD